MRQSVFVHEHRLHPSLTIGRDQLYNSLKIVPFKTLAFKDLTNFLSLAFRLEVDMTMLDVFEASPIIEFGFGPKIVAGRHRESVGKQIGESQHENYPIRKLRAGDSGYNGKCRDGAVDAAVDPVAQIVVPWTSFQPAANGVRRMIVFHQ